MNTTKNIIVILLLITTPIFAQHEGQVREPVPETKVKTPKGQELVAKRTLKSTSWYNATSNTVTVEISSGYLHYRDDNGRLRTIDRRPSLKHDSSGYAVTKGLYQAHFPFDLTSADAHVVFRMQDGTAFRARPTSLVYYDQNSGRVVTVENLQPHSATVAGNTIRYTGAFPGIDVVYEYLDTRLKQTIVLAAQARRNLPNPATLGLNPAATFVSIQSEYDLPDSLDAFVDGTPVSVQPPGQRKRIDFEGENPLRVRNSRGQGKFALPADLAFALSRTPADTAARPDGIPGRTMQRRFFHDNGKNLLLTGVPYTWLVAQPPGAIVLDPTVELQPVPEEVDDTFIYKANGGDDNHGALHQLQIGPDRGNYERRGLVKFDLPAIHRDATVTSATLELYLFATWGTASGFTMQAHTMLRSWVEGSGSSWNGGNTSGCDWHYADQPDSTTWNASGMQADTDYDSNVLDSEEISASSTNVWHAWDVTTAAQTWVADPDDNHGMALITESADISLYIGGQFRSSDYTSDTSKRPKLTITYHIDPLVTIHYDALSRPDTIWFANGVTEINTYDDNRNWLTKREYKRGSTNIYTFDSSDDADFDAVGNLKKVVYTHKSDDPDSMEYGYDVHNRLVEFKHEGNVLRDYEYDPNGNITDFDGNPFRYSYRNNQLSYAHGDSFRYDASGRATWIDTGAASITLTYDIFSNMTEYGADNKYTYDAANQRLRKTENGDSTYYVTNGLEVLAEYDENDNLQAEHIYGLGRMLVKFDSGGERTFFYTDHLGSTRLVSGESEASDDMRRDYYPYGEALTAAGNDDTPYTFTGKELDSSTDLHYFGARYYDARIGRFLTIDRFADKYPSHTPYQYALNNPLGFIDINGDSTFVVINVDGTYTVTGGNLSGAEDDTGIYVKDADGNPVLVGRSITTHSFFSDEGEAVAGAVIDPASYEGALFILGEIIGADPSLIGYMSNATGGQKYDFKSRGLAEAEAKGVSRSEHHYRGSAVPLTGDIPIFGSARDFGNIGAGIVAGRAGLSWGEARLGFDALESLQQREIAKEGTPTQKAQKVGHAIGVRLRKID